MKSNGNNLNYDVMMKQILIGFVCMVYAVQLNGQNSVSGKVIDEKGNPLLGATVVIEEHNLGAVTNFNGVFIIEDLANGSMQMKISFIGYRTNSKLIIVRGDVNIGEITLELAPYRGREVTISALKASEKTPMAFTNISKDEIKQRNFGQDVPFLVGSTPSMITSSDAGHGIGYTSMRIRGTDANRINVTINGVPLNDAESQSVFWVDLPELASSTEQIQIQRGVGTSTNGAAAFGATVNMQTNLLKKDAYANYEATLGSFSTIRNSISAGTGLMHDKFAVDMRLSDLSSDGYIDRSWTDLQSYYLSAAYYSEKSSLKFITFGGFEELYQSWDGVPSYLLESDRTYNGLGVYTDSTDSVQSYDKQVDHYNQIHYQLHYARSLSNKLHLNAALHYTRGEGYYEQYESGEDYAFYGLEAPIIGTDTLSETDLVRRKNLLNDFYGAIASINYDGENSTAILGGGWNSYYGLHYGTVIWAQHFGINSPGHKWYEGIGDKTDWNVYGKYYYFATDKLNTFIDLQVRGVNHDIEGTDSKNREVTQNHEFLFFNPKAGVNFEPFKGHRAFISFARANREPNRNNYTDAPVDRQPIKETLHDYEAGYSISSSHLKTGVTLYFMDYTDQLVLTGQINEVGYPIMTNVENSFRAGVEFEAAWKIIDMMQWNLNFTLSRNQIKDFTNYVDNWSYWDDPATEPYQFKENVGTSTLAYSPSIVVNNQLIFSPVKNLEMALVSKYVGKQYVDNTANDNFKLDPYFVNDLRISYSIEPEKIEEIRLSLLVANLLNEKYESNAWLYRYYYGGSEYALDGYFPQAGTHFMLGISMSF
jgi:iron complex outermembrane recepter protein